MYEEFIPNIEEKSNGRLIIDYYPAGQIAGAKELPDAVTTGRADMIYTYDGYYTASVTMASIQSVPFLMAHPTDVLAFFVRLIDDGVLAEVVGKSWEGAYNVVWLGGMINSPFHIVAKGKFIKRPEDMKGMMMRSPVPMWADFAQRWGAGTEWMTAPDLYLGLQRGTVDMAIMAAGSTVSYKYYELGLHRTWGLPTMASHCSLTINKDKFNSLSADLQQILSDETPKFFRYIVVEVDAPAVAACRTIWEDPKWNNFSYDATPEDVAAWNEAALPVIADWCEDVPGLKEAIEVIESYK